MKITSILLYLSLYITYSGLVNHYTNTYTQIADYFLTFYAIMSTISVIFISWASGYLLRHKYRINKILISKNTNIAMIHLKRILYFFTVLFAFFVLDKQYLSIVMLLNAIAYSMLTQIVSKYGRKY